MIKKKKNENNKEIITFFSLTANATHNFGCRHTCTYTRTHTRAQICVKEPWWHLKDLYDPPEWQ